jgi:hypothetical protein
MHIHMIINVALLNTPFPHFIFIILDGLLNQKIISTSFFSQETMHGIIFSYDPCIFA